MRTSEYGRDYRIGYGVGVLEQGRLNLQIGVDAERRESSLFQMQEQGAGTDQRVLGRATVIGDSLRACSPAGRGTEVVLACNILNQITGLGRPMSYRIGR